ncbi:3-ketoacyl-ACP synthase [Streptomyces tateyamensis]|uniref:3-ketoacyl-ACP synthase n=1 Tax=Streptomyces tateyamensis TaxID=565073 RepID=A0A2V4NB26_9ACTN|nr:beta-ketoacyl synthase N-terminal-like domain-containing protein [Streptomyces tateyamensis]PYC78844.1 3-ketoacyl-ACP synthase [Streptomyces tateyamensis]
MTAVPVLVTGLAVRSGTFAPVTRFDVSNRQAVVAATQPGDPDLAGQLAEVLTEVGVQGSPVLLALHGDERARPITAGLAARFGVDPRVYTGACVAASTAVADAAALIAAGRAERLVVAAGYLVEPDTFAVFDAGRALSRSGVLRPFSRGRDGLLLGDAVVALALEAGPAAGRSALARITGWGRAGDGYHVCRPDPSGAGLARAIRAALDRAGVGAAQVGWLNANGTGSPIGDAAEAAALALAFGEQLAELPVSSTKSLHGHALEASALLELAVTIDVLAEGKVPVNAGWLGPDEQCRLNVVVDAPRTLAAPHLLTVNSAFGGANTALLVGAP